MIADRIEGKWIDLFAEVFALLQGGAAAMPARSSRKRQSRALNVQLAELALRGSARGCSTCSVPTPRQTAPVPVRSTGASTRSQGCTAAVGALAGSALRRRLHRRRPACTPPELPRDPGGRRAGAVRLATSIPRCSSASPPAPDDEQKVRGGDAAAEGRRSACSVTSAAGTDLAIGLEGARVGGVWGFTEKPGTLSHWPGGLCLALSRRRQRERHAGARAAATSTSPSSATSRPRCALTIENDYVTDDRRRRRSMPS